VTISDDYPFTVQAVRDLIDAEDSEKHVGRIELRFLILRVIGGTSTTWRYHNYNRWDLVDQRRGHQEGKLAIVSVLDLNKI